MRNTGFARVRIILAIIFPLRNPPNQLVPVDAQMFCTEPRDSTDLFVFEFKGRVGPADKTVPDQVDAVADVRRRRMEREVVGIEDGGRRPVTGCHATIVQNPVCLPDLVEAVQLVKYCEVGSLSGDCWVTEEPALGWKQ